MKKCTFTILVVFLISNISAQQQLSNFSYNSVSISDQSNFINYKGLIYFEASTDGFGREIWHTDGTQANTSILKDIFPGNNNGVINSLQPSSVLNGTLYFIASDGTSKGEIWKTDGTSDGTVAVTDFLDGRTTKLTSAGDRLFFLVQKNDTLQVWMSNGTKEGTILVKDSLPIWNTPTFQGKCNDVFIFTFQPHGTNNSKVWRSDGTANGTFPITDEIDGNGSGVVGTAALTQYIEHNNKLYFVSRFHLHETDGTKQNTKAIADIWQASLNLVGYSDVIEVNDKLYFSFFKAETCKLSIWESDGTTLGTKEIYSKQSNRYFMPSNLSKSNNSLIFCGPNSTGATTLQSLNTNNFEATDIKILADNTDAPFVFGFWNACRIEQFSDNEYFILSNDQKGWISDLKTNITNNVIELDSVWSTFSYNHSLLYSKNYQLHKYAGITNEIKSINQSHLTFYPNPTSDYVTFGGNDRFEYACLYDVYGKCLIKKTVLDNKAICVTDLSRGIYIIECQLNGKKFIGKLIKE